METETLIGKKVKRLADGKEVTIKNEKFVEDLCIYTDTEGNIYEESELDIRYKVTPWYLLYDALRDNGLVGTMAWDHHQNCIKSAFNDFMESMQKAGYISQQTDKASSNE